MAAAKRRIHPHRSLRDTVYHLVDMIGIAAGLYLAAAIHGKDVDEFHLLAGSAAIIVYYLACEASGMYRNWRGVSIEREILCAVLTWGATLPILLALSVMTHSAIWVDRSLVLAWWLLAIVLIVLIRIAVRLTQCWLRSRGYNTRGYAIVGLNELGFDLARRIEHAPELGLKLIGFYDDRQRNRLPDLPSDLGHHVGSITQLLHHARQGRVNMIYITFPMRAEQRIKNVLAELGDTTASVYIVPDFFVFELLHSRWTNISGLPAVSVFENPLYGIDGVLKRAVDLILASLMLLVLALPMIVIAVLVKMSSPGPVFFRQKRYGLDGQEIRVWKFRTYEGLRGQSYVYAGHPQRSRVTTASARSSAKPHWTNCRSCSTCSKAACRWSGRGPHASLQNEEYRSLIQGYMLRHKVKPGITGLAQVNGYRGETDTLEKMAKRIECDHRYIREWSLCMDLKILLKTVLVVFSQQNAY